MPTRSRCSNRSAPRSRISRPRSSLWPGSTPAQRDMAAKPRHIAGMSSNPVFCAIDTADLARARALVEAVSPHVGGVKLGLEFFVANGPEGVRRVAPHAPALFLDLKLHD